MPDKQYSLPVCPPPAPGSLEEALDLLVLESNQPQAPAPMPAAWCAARRAEIQATVDAPSIFLSWPQARTMLIELLAQLKQAEAKLARFTDAGTVEACEDVYHLNDVLDYLLMRSSNPYLEAAHEFLIRLSASRNYGRDLINDMTAEAHQSSEQIAQLHTRIGEIAELLDKTIERLIEDCNTATFEQAQAYRSHIGILAKFQEDAGLVMRASPEPETFRAEAREWEEGGQYGG